MPDKRKTVTAVAASSESKSASARVQASAVPVAKKSKRKDDAVVAAVPKKKSKSDNAAPAVPAPAPIPGPTDPKERDALKKKRLELNRIAAIKSRKKKKQYVNNLMANVEALSRENKTLWAENRNLRHMYHALREAHGKAFEENVSQRQNLSILYKAFDSLLKACEGKKTVAAAVSAATAAAAPVTEEIERKEKNGELPVAFKEFPTTAEAAKSSNFAEAPASNNADGDGSYEYSARSIQYRFPATYANNYGNRAKAPPAKAAPSSAAPVAVVAVPTSSDKPVTVKAVAAEDAPASGDADGAKPAKGKAKASARVVAKGLKPPARATRKSTRKGGAANVAAAALAGLHRN